MAAVLSAAGDADCAAFIPVTAGGNPEDSSPAVSDKRAGELFLAAASSTDAAINGAPDTAGVGCSSREGMSPDVANKGADQSLVAAAPSGADAADYAGSPARAAGGKQGVKWPMMPRTTKETRVTTCSVERRSHPRQGQFHGLTITNVAAITSSDRSAGRYCRE